MKTILVTDDDRDTNEIFCRLLQKNGYRTLSALNGEDALRLLQTSHPDLLILDVMMPGIDGMEVLRRVRSNPTTSGLPVILFSAVTDPRFQDHAREKGANDYWVKGAVDFSHLDNLIGKYVA